MAPPGSDSVSCHTSTSMDLTINVWRVGIPLHSWVTDAESVCVGERSGQIYIFDLSPRPNVIHVVEPARGCKDVGVSASANL